MDVRPACITHARKRMGIVVMNRSEIFAVKKMRFKISLYKHLVASRFRIFNICYFSRVYILSLTHRRKFPNYCSWSNTHNLNSYVTRLFIATFHQKLSVSACTREVLQCFWHSSSGASDRPSPSLHPCSFSVKGGQPGSGKSYIIQVNERTSSLVAARLRSVHRLWAKYCTLSIRKCVRERSHTEVLMDNDVSKWQTIFTLHMLLAITVHTIYRNSL